ncbi:MAG: fumarylacetoacetase, partial [Flavobacteriia bacterium]|nr:fumarylacetoacetase [Flavobacteriia bacterium]
MRYANDPQRRSWLTVPQDSDFPIQNLPFGIFSTENEVVSAGTRIGDAVIDLAALHQLGYFQDLESDLPDDVFLQNTLNAFIELGKPVTRALRDRLAQLFDLQEPALRDNEAHRKEVLHAVEDVQMLLPVFVQDYTDFYSSRE